MNDGSKRFLYNSTRNIVAMRHADKYKNENPAIKMLAGHVASVRVRCGKSNCHCARTGRHIAHYLVIYRDGLRFRRYVRRDEVASVRDACQAHRDLQAQLRAGRAQYKESLAQTRNLAKLLASESESKDKAF
jgi:hypothetical protein